MRIAAAVKPLGVRPVPNRNSLLQSRFGPRAPIGRRSKILVADDCAEMRKVVLRVRARWLRKSARRSMASGPSESERRIVATMHRDSIRRELANRSAAAQVHEDRQEQAYWQLWRLVRSAHVGAIPPQILDASVPDHVTLALSVVADFDEAREEPGSFAESLYRPVSSLPYSPAVIRKCCEFLICIADSPATSFGGDRDLLLKERDALGLAAVRLPVPAAEHAVPARG